MSTIHNKYRFIPTMMPGAYGVFDANTGTRVPGYVTTTKVGEQRIFTYTREMPVKGKKPALVSFNAKTVAELSQLVDQYFSPHN